MFRSFRSRDRVDKAVRSSKKSYREHTKMKLQQKLDSPSSVASTLTSPIIALVVGPDQRHFAAHEDVLCLAPFFAARLHGQFRGSSVRKLELPEEQPEILSCVLEYLYKGDYYPRLLFNKRRNSWELENARDPLKVGGRGSTESTIYHPGVGGELLKDTAIYCLAEKYGLEELKRLSLRKQGLQSGIPVAVIMRSARFTYDNTPDSDSGLRSHYLTLIVRSRQTFKRSGTMQMEMEIGGSKLFFDLFVAMCAHLDGLVDDTNKASPRTI